MDLSSAERPAGRRQPGSTCCEGEAVFIIRFTMCPPSGTGRTRARSAEPPVAAQCFMLRMCYVDDDL